LVLFEPEKKFAYHNELFWAKKIAYHNELFWASIFSPEESRTLLLLTTIHYL
jgi:hypothetical protein